LLRPSSTLRLTPNSEEFVTSRPLLAPTSCPDAPQNAARPANLVRKAQLLYCLLGCLRIGAGLFELRGQLGRLHVRRCPLRLQRGDLDLQAVDPVAPSFGPGPFGVPALLRPPAGRPSISATRDKRMPLGPHRTPVCWPLPGSVSPPCSPEPRQDAPRPSLCISLTQRIDLAL
jgi:hypothetical protein